MVSTDVDESDASATPSSPGGTGLSLREAITYAESTAGAQTIAFAGPMTIVLGSPLPDFLDPAGSTVVGEAGVLIDGTAAGGVTEGCFDLIGSGHRLIAIEIINCPGYGIHGQGPTAVIADCSVHDNRCGLRADGAGSIIGPGNNFGFNRWGIHLDGAVTVEDNSIHDSTENAIRILNNGDGSIIRRNTIAASGWGGVLVVANTDNLTIVHNTLHGNAVGLDFANSTSGHDIRNNLFTASTDAAILTSTSTFAVLSHNDYFGNAGGDCVGSGCAIETDVFGLDPGHVDAAAGDFRLLPGSPVIDLGMDLGLDVNGPEPGSFNGAAPEPGAWEAPAGY